MRPAKLCKPTVAGPPEDFSWVSNPLDWRPIDRFILLASLVMIAPVLFGGSLLAALVFTPFYLVGWAAYLLLGLYAVHALVLGSCIVMAFHYRRYRDDWPAFENLLIVSFVINVLTSSYATGTHFAQGLTLIFLGISIASALANVRKVYWVWLVTCCSMVVIAAIDFSGSTPPAPLFAHSPLRPDDSPRPGWLALQVVVGAILLAISRISLLAISRWVERENLYREMSTVDGLTRLANRRTFVERGHCEFSRVQRSITSGSVACIMLDLDHFKRINDTWGHHAGDQVLVVVSSILLESSRHYDEIGRYGGEEFALLLPGVTLADAVVVAERIRKRVAETCVEVDGNRIAMSVSLGVALYPAPGVDSFNDLLKAADRALYLAKNSGRNKVCIEAPNREIA